MLALMFKQNKLTRVNKLMWNELETVKILYEVDTKRWN